MGGIISGILGGGEKSDDQEAQLESMRAMAAGIRDYRPEAMQARINAMNQSAKQYQGASNALETMYGGRHVGEAVGGASPMSNPAAGNPQLAPFKPAWGTNDPFLSLDLSMLQPPDGSKGGV